MAELFDRGSQNLIRMSNNGRWARILTRRAKPVRVRPILRRFHCIRVFLSRLLCFAATFVSWLPCMPKSALNRSWEFICFPSFLAICSAKVPLTTFNQKSNILVGPCFTVLHFPVFLVTYSPKFSLLLHWNIIGISHKYFFKLLESDQNLRSWDLWGRKFEFGAKRLLSGGPTIKRSKGRSRIITQQIIDGKICLYPLVTISKVMFYRGSQCITVHEK